MRRAMLGFAHLAPLMEGSGLAVDGLGTEDKPATTVEGRTSM